MAHWATEKFDELEDAVSGTGWTLSKSSTDRGPLEFEHEDGSELFFTDSRSRTGTMSVEYHDSDSAKEAVKDKRTSWARLENAVEWVVHILEKHEQDN